MTHQLGETTYALARSQAQGEQFLTALKAAEKKPLSNKRKLNHNANPGTKPKSERRLLN